MTGPSALDSRGRATRAAAPSSDSSATSSANAPAETFADAHADTAAGPAPETPPAAPPESHLTPATPAQRAAALARATGSPHRIVQHWLIDDVARALPDRSPGDPSADPARGFTFDGTPQSRTERLSAAVAALGDIGPRDTLEGMLAAQMVAVHAAALGCLQRSAARGGLPRAGAADGRGEEPDDSTPPANPRVAEGLRHRDLHEAARLLHLFERQVRLRDDRRNPALARSIAGKRWDGPGRRHENDVYGSVPAGDGSRARILPDGTSWTPLF